MSICHCARPVAADRSSPAILVRKKNEFGEVDRPAEFGLPEIGPRQIGQREPGPGYVGVGEVRASKLGFGEIDIDEVRAVKFERCISAPANTAP